MRYTLLGAHHSTMQRVMHDGTKVNVCASFKAKHFRPPTSSPALRDAPQGPKARSSIVLLQPCRRVSEKNPGPPHILIRNRGFGSRPSLAESD